MNNHRSIIRLCFLTIMCVLVLSSRCAWALGESSASKSAQTAPSNFNYGISLNTLFDINRNRENRSYQNDVSASVEYQYSKNIDFDFGIESRLDSFASEIYANQTRSQETSFDLGASYHRNVLTSSTWNNHLGYTLPLSEENSYQQSLGNILALTETMTPFYSDRYLLINRLEGTYIFNVYEKSPSSLRFNIDSVESYSLVNVFKILPRIKFLAGGSAKNIHYMDDSNILSYATFLGISFSYNNFEFAVTALNGNSLDQENSGPLYFDEYRQMVKLSLRGRF